MVAQYRNVTNVSNGFLYLENINSEEISKLYKTKLSVPTSEYPLYRKLTSIFEVIQI